MSWDGASLVNLSFYGKLFTWEIGTRTAEESLMLFSTGLSV